MSPSNYSQMLNRSIYSGFPLEWMEKYTCLSSRHHMQFKHNYSFIFNRFCLVKRKNKIKNRKAEGWGDTITRSPKQTTYNSTYKQGNHRNHIDRGYRSLGLKSSHEYINICNGTEISGFFVTLSLNNCH